MSTITDLQKRNFFVAFNVYKKKYMIKEDMGLKEPDVRSMIDYFLTKVLGFDEYGEIKTDHIADANHGDYVIHVNRMKHFVIEICVHGLNINDKMKVVENAYNEGINWIVLTNGKNFLLYRIVNKNGLHCREAFNVNIAIDDIDAACDSLVLLTRKCIDKKCLDQFWSKLEILDPEACSELLYKKSITSELKKQIKKRSGIKFSDADILDTVHRIINNMISLDKPEKPIE